MLVNIKNPIKKLNIFLINRLVIVRNTSKTVQIFTLETIWGLPWWFSGKESACNAGDLGLIPGSGRSPGEGNSNPFQYPCLGNSRDRGACQATVHGVTKESDTI